MVSTALYRKMDILGGEFSLVGVGNGPFIALAYPLLDAASPPHRRTVWLATLFVCLPLGFSCGFFVGGELGQTLGWRAVFGFQALAMLPLLALFLPPFQAPKELRFEHPRAWEAECEDDASGAVDVPAYRVGSWMQMNGELDVEGGGRKEGVKHAEGGQDVQDLKDSMGRGADSVKEGGILEDSKGSMGRGMEDGMGRDKNLLAAPHPPVP
ncbi:hypothetical protein H632_c3649p0, partial [Helicosporidium sp. ATCC 50920]